MEKKNFLLTPTPIQELLSFSKELGCQIHVKRDDLLGVGFGGNKLRKLEYLLADAEKKKAKLIVTSGSLQTNHGMLTALCSVKAGLPCLLMLLIEESSIQPVLSGNLLLDDYIGCDLEFLDVSDIMGDAELSVNEKDNRVSERLEACVRKKLPLYLEKYKISEKEVYRISSAGSTPVGMQGYINCIREIAGQSKEHYDYIFCGNGSGGTYGGMLLGAKLYMPHTRVIGVAIEEMNPDKPQFILKLIHQTEKLMGISEQIVSEDIEIIQNSVNKGYAVPDEETMDIIEMFAQREGFFLDPVYTGKIFNGSLKYIQENLRGSGKNILILHSGGAPGLFNENMICYRNQRSSVVNRWKYDKN